MKPLFRIDELARRLGLDSQTVEPYGWYRGKFTFDYLSALPSSSPKAKYIDVTAISPTPFGEGKTVTSISLSMGFWKNGAKSIVTLRQPSMAPMFGIKGGGVGAGRAALVPADEMNLHFTGDIHAVTSATNLLAALIDNHVKRNQAPVLEAKSITWRRSLDSNDKALARIDAGLDGGLRGPHRQTGFDLSAASEVMAILALAPSFDDFLNRLENIWVGTTLEGEPVTAKHLKASGAMAAIMRDAYRPNLVQTLEGTPALLHAGPFANIAHGNSSVIADRVALSLTDYVVTESGFGSDCGGEKFFHIKCRSAGFKPDVEVLVCTIRAMKWHSGKFGTKLSKASLPSDINEPDVEAVKKGLINLIGHIELLKKFGIPIVVAINRFPTDTEAEIDAVREVAIASGVAGCEVCTGFTEGGEGARALAAEVARVAETRSETTYLYEISDSIETKLTKLAQRVYGAKAIELTASARESVARLTRLKMDNLPICVAKTQYSFSHDPEKLGRPSGFVFPIREIGAYAGAQFLYALSGDILTMPGLPAKPAAWGISVDSRGRISGLK